MNIDFEKILYQVLPTSIRVGLTDIVKSFAYPFTIVYDLWKNWYDDLVLQSAITCQVMYLELIINSRLFGNYSRTIYITDGDQVTSDFIVNVPAGLNYNVQQLVGLLDKYKPTGKRYTIGQSDIVYEIQWINHVCELVDQQFIVHWTNPVCETVNMTENKVVASLNSVVDGGGAHHYCKVDLQYNAASNLTVVVWTNLGNYTVNVPSGANTAKTTSGAFDYQTAYILSITPSVDETFYYKKSIWPL